MTLDHFCVIKKNCFKPLNFLALHVENDVKNINYRALKYTTSFCTTFIKTIQINALTNKKRFFFYVQQNEKLFYPIEFFCFTF